MISLQSILLRLCLALLFGAIIGFEREINEHSAGMRTNALVALGSSLFMIISGYGFTEFLTIPRMQVDPSRIASYVVAGIGFLGAGAIFRSQDNERVKGLTTAAAIWIVAAIGLACGVGLLWEATAATVLALVVLVGLQYVEKYLLHVRPSGVLRIHIEAEAVTGQLVGQIYDICERSGLDIGKLSLHATKTGESIDMACKFESESTLAHAIVDVRALPAVNTIHVYHPRDANVENTSVK